MTKIGFIGIGVMGSSMAGHLLAAGHTVAIYTRTKAKAEALLAKGALWCESPAEIAACSEIIGTIVGYPRDVEEIYFGEKGLLQGDVAGKLFIDFTTSTPSLAEKIAQAAAEKGAVALDAPVSGGDLGAKRAALTIMVGGATAAFERAEPIFKLVGQQYRLHGGPGKGQHAKMANQIMIAGTMTGMTETLVYAKAAELDAEAIIETLSGGAAANWSLKNYGPRILQKDYTPGFFVKHYIKDLKIALDEAEKLQLELPGTRLARELYEKLAEQGFEDDGTQALIKLWWHEDAIVEKTQKK